jgi:hypothetical protein
MLFAAGILSHRVVLHTIVGDSGNPDTIITMLLPRLAIRSDRSLALNDDSYLVGKSSKEGSLVRCC